MKRATIAMTILLGLLAASVWNGWYLTRQTEGLIAVLEETEIAIQGEDWQQALTLTEQVEEAWLRQDFYHHLILSADILDELESHFQELRRYLAAQDGPEASAVAGRLMTRLRMSAYEEQLRPENFL